LSSILLHQVTNALIGAASDPEPVVRVAAVQALGFTGDMRAASALASHLTDPARVVRANAAQGLLRLGISHLDDAYGKALLQAQADYADSLSIFHDVAEDHVSLGWLKAEMSDTAGALRELQTGLALDPRNGMAYVYLGVIAARSGKYGQAIGDWERAKALGAGSAAIDRLISEARKRAGH
jgi:tetratricopeptide (TPR) repeat protein